MDTFIVDTLSGVSQPQQSSFGYDCTEPKKRRKAPTGVLRSEDDELRSEKRRQVTSSTRELYRNFGILSWAVRTHLDYTSSFVFDSVTGNEELDRQIERLMARYSKKENCDIAGRHRLSRMIRIAEAMRVLEGDIFFNLLSNGMLQVIEGDRVRNPIGVNNYLGFDPFLEVSPSVRYVNGVRVNEHGKALGYAVHRRRWGGGFELDRVIDAKNVLQHGYFDTRFDQVRGVTPLSAAINALRDAYEGIDYALVKAKIAQLFGLITTRDSDGAVIPPLPEDEDDEDAPIVTSEQLTGLFTMDLDVGEDAKILESKNPSTEFQNFMEIVIGIALKSLDIPYSFYAENYTNYTGQLAARQRYQRSSKSKQEDNRELLNDITDWLLFKWVARGELVLPEGMTVDDIEYEWIAQSVNGLLDPNKELTGYLMAVGAGIMTLDDVTKTVTGKGLPEVLSKRKAEQDLIERSGVKVADPSGLVKQQAQPQQEQPEEQSPQRPQSSTPDATPDESPEDNEDA